MTLPSCQSPLDCRLFCHHPASLLEPVSSRLSDTTLPMFQGPSGSRLFGHDPTSLAKSSEAGLLQTLSWLLPTVLASSWTLLPQIGGGGMWWGVDLLPPPKSQHLRSSCHSPGLYITALCSWFLELLSPHALFLTATNIHFPPQFLLFFPYPFTFIVSILLFHRNLWNLETEHHKEAENYCKVTSLCGINLHT